MSKYKILKEKYSQELEKKTILCKELKHTQEDLAGLCTFLEWLNRKTVEEGWQMCGMKKWQDNVYLAFLLEHSYASLPSYTYNYTLYGYLSSNLRTPVYQGEFSWCQKYSVGNDARHLTLDKCYIKDDCLCGKGIGTLAIGIIKNVARQLQCGEIIGRRMVLKKTYSPEEKWKEEDILFRYYEKNGFVQSRESDEIIYTVEKYQHD